MMNATTISSIPPAPNIARAWQDVHNSFDRRDLDARLLIIGRPSLGEWLERRALDLDTLAIASVAPPDHLINEAPLGGKVRELMRAAQQHFVAKHILEVTVRALD